MCLSKVGSTDNTDVGNIVKKYATKRQDSIAPHTLIRKINGIIIVGFPGLIQRQGLASWNINMNASIIHLHMNLVA